MANTIYEGTLPLTAYTNSTTDDGVGTSTGAKPGRGSETGLEVHILDDRYPLRGLVSGKICGVMIHFDRFDQYARSRYCKSRGGWERGEIPSRIFPSGWRVEVAKLA